MQNFGITKKGEQASLFVLENKKHMKAAVTDYGASLVQLWVPDDNGQLYDVVLGYDDVSGYEKGDVFFGATVGRVANRIKGASFELGGVSYSLEKNSGENSLHGGKDFMNQRMWAVKEKGDMYITFALFSPDGDQGYPGNVEIQVTYTLTEDNELKIHYYAVPDKDTILNLTNHSYFNLSGHASGNVLEQEVMLDANAFTMADEELIPTGEVIAVEGTPMDFRIMKSIGQDVAQDYEALIFGGGYDHNWVLNGSGMRKVAAMYSPETEISMEVYTDLPGIQFYIGNFLDDEAGKEGAIYRKRSGACFETQYFPDAIHKDNFVKPIVHAGEVFETTTVYKFL
ncbi:MAG: aldose epimerase family protein [Dorea sp.]